MFDREMARRAAENLNLIRRQRPLVHNITNYVVMNSTANALLALGASPVMAHAAEEVEEMVSLAQALVLNIGTLSTPWVEAMLAAGKRANDLDIPVVLDPVGAGATRMRTASAMRLIEKLSIRVIRGNASEILALCAGGREASTKGVDSVEAVEQVTETASALAKKLGLTLAVTGVVDLVTNGVRVCRVMNGDGMMSRVTGTGCAATAVVGAFLAVVPDGFEAAVSGLACFGLAGEKAAAVTSGPGSFQVALLDALYRLSADDLASDAKVVT
jgi:hydroxyethylthiazole kinase